MVLGLLPEIRGGLGELARTGQHSRFLDGYLTPYVRAFAEIRYFSYLRESLGDYTRDPELVSRCRLFAGGSRLPWFYTFFLPFRYRRQLRGCAVLRVFQLTGVIPALAAKRLWGVPFVTTYGFHYARLAGSRAAAWLHRGLEAVGLAAADAVIVTTPALAAYVSKRAGAARVHLIPNGVDSALFQPVPRKPSSSGHVLYVGRLAAEKNLETLIAAAGALNGRFHPRLTFVGDGPLRVQLLALAERLGVPVEVVPFVDHRKLPALLAQADAFVLPSWTEGHPKVLLEAMSCALPCLASDVEGNRAVIDDGKTGLLFDPGNTGALAAGLERVFTEDQLARSLGEQARARIVERYDLGDLVTREIELLRRLGEARGA
jgi:glycosyltransferase involved in cell wall biosynthesis